jgi:hypothetical protein
MAKRVVTVVMGWIEVDIDDDATIEQVLQAAQIEPGEGDVIWTEYETGIALDQPVEADRYIMVMTALPVLVNEEEDEEESEDDDEDDDDEVSDEETTEDEAAGNESTSVSEK